MDFLHHTILQDLTMDTKLYFKMTDPHNHIPHTQNQHPQYTQNQQHSDYHGHHQQHSQSIQSQDLNQQDSPTEQQHPLEHQHLISQHNSIHHQEQSGSLRGQSQHSDHSQHLQNIPNSDQQPFLVQQDADQIDHTQSLNQQPPTNVEFDDQELEQSHESNKQQPEANSDNANQDYQAEDYRQANEIQHENESQEQHLQSQSLPSYQQPIHIQHQDHLQQQLIEPEKLQSPPQHVSVQSNQQQSHGPIKIEQTPQSLINQQYKVPQQSTIMQQQQQQPHIVNQPQPEHQLQQNQPIVSAQKSELVSLIKPVEEPIQIVAEPEKKAKNQTTVSKVTKKKKEKTVTKERIVISNNQDKKDNNNDLEIKPQIKQTQIKHQNKIKIEKKSSGNDNNEDDSEQPNRDSGLKQSNIETEAASQLEAQTEIMNGLIIKEAQKQRINSTLEMFLNFMEDHNKHTSSQKSVIKSVYDQIQRKRNEKYSLYFVYKEYFNTYASLAKEFYERSYKISRDNSHIDKNRFINITEELKEGIDQLFFLRKETGNDYHRLQDFINIKIQKQIEVTFNRYISEMNKAQAAFNEKKKTTSKLEELFKKEVWKLTKVYSRGKAGKNQEEDVFVETCKFIKLERQFREGLIFWGKGLIELRKTLRDVDKILAEQVQLILNNFKNQANLVYSIHRVKYDKIIQSKDQILNESKFSKLCALSDLDYVKYALEVAKKFDAGEIQDKQFEYFLDMPHFELTVGKSTQLLKGMVNKSFNLKSQNEELINTISGNLVVFNRATTEYKDKFCIKHISAQIVAEGVIQIDELIPGIIFNNNRTVRLALKDEDRAEQLICFLDQKL